MLLCDSCNHHEVIYEELSSPVYVDIRFDWSEDPEASPKGMTVYFYRVNTKSSTPAYIFDFKGSNGGQVKLRPGKYAALCYNNDSDAHGFIGVHAFEEFGLKLGTLRSGSGLSSRVFYVPESVDERVANEPDLMWVSALESVEIVSITETEDSQAQVVCFPMVAVTSHYKFIVHHPINFTKSTSVSASLSGLAGTVHPGRGLTGDETVTHVFDMALNAEGRLEGHLLTFGHCENVFIGTRRPKDNFKHILSFYTLSGSATSHISSHDVTSQIHNSKERDCIIELDSLVFPEKGPSGGDGMSPTVGGWTGSQETVGL